MVMTCQLQQTITTDLVLDGYSYFEEGSNYSYTGKEYFNEQTEKCLH